MKHSKNPAKPEPPENAKHPPPEEESVIKDTLDDPASEQVDTPHVDAAGEVSESSDVADCLDLIGRVKEHSPQCLQEWQSETDAGEQRLANQMLAAIGRYKILEVVGQGGYGIVYKALDQELDRLVALKIPRLETQLRDSEKQRFLQEAKAMCRLSHPNLATIFEAGHVGQTYYIASKLYSGGTLGDVLGKETKLPQRVSAELVLSLAQAVQHAHSRGILHRDIKPTNVLFEADNTDDNTVLVAVAELVEQARLIDFGLAKILDTDVGQTQTGALLGTPEYMSPEQAESRTDEIGVASDVYSLGAILYRALVGRPPHQGESLLATLAAVRDDQPIAPSHWDRSIAPDLEAICLKCLEKDPVKRYTTAQALAEDLESWLAGKSIKARLPTVPERLQRWCVRNPAWAILVATVFLALTGTSIAIGVAYSRVQTANRSLLTSNLELQKSRELEEKRAEQLLQSLNAQVSVVLEDMLARSFELTDAHREYFAKTLEAYEAFTTENDDDPRSLAASAKAYVRIGQIQNRLGDRSAAIAALSLADQKFAQVTDTGETSPALLSEHAQAIGLLGTFLKDSQQLEASRDAASKALQITKSLIEQFPSNSAYLRTALKQQALLANIENASGHTDAGAEVLHKAIKRGTEELGGAAEDQYLLAKLKSSLAQLLFASREFSKIESLLAEADSSMQALLKESPDDLGYLNLRASILNMFGYVFLSTGRMDEAQTNLEALTTLRRDMANRYPAQTELQSEYILALNNFGSVLKQSHKTAEAIARWEEGHQAAKRLVTRGSEDPFIHSQLSAMALHLAQDRLEGQQLELATQLAEEGKQAIEFALQANQQHPMFRQVLGEQYLVFARLYSAQELHDLAFEQTVLWSGMGGSPPGVSLSIARVQAKAALAARNAGDLEAAETRKLATEKTLQGNDPAIINQWQEIEEDSVFLSILSKEELAELQPNLQSGKATSAQP